MRDHAASHHLARKLAAPPPPGTGQGLPVPGSETPNRSAIYRHWRFVSEQLLSQLDPKIATVHDLFESTVHEYPNNRCLGTRNWNPQLSTWENNFEWMTYVEIAKRRADFGAGIAEIHSNLESSNGKRGVGIWSPNRPEWQISDLGCMSQGFYTVSLYETLGPDATEYIIKHAELACVICSLPHIPTLLNLAPNLPSLKLIVSMDPLSGGELPTYSKSAILNKFASKQGIRIYSMGEVESIGAESRRPMSPVAASDNCTINYTSGTTGPPKGVVITHSAALAANCAARIAGGARHDDVYISYLPLAHMYGRLIEQVALAEGAGIGYFRGDVAGLVEDMKILQPSGFTSVPRLYNRMNSALRTATVDAGGTKGALSRHIVNAKLASMKDDARKATNQHWLYDRIWTNRVRSSIGLGKARTMISGSAPLDPDSHQFLRAAMGTNFLQGYGMTETGGVASTQLVGDFSTGNVGPPAPCVEVCLESIPELSYTVDDRPYPRGELLVRGPSMFAQYYKNEEENQKTIEPNGWFHTGDVAFIDELGRLHIIDRKKNVLKLSHGEYLSPQRIENTYLANCILISSAFVHGDTNQSALIGIFGVDPENFAQFAGKVAGETIHHGDAATLARMAADPQVKKAVLETLDLIGQHHGFNSYEKVKNILLAVDPFTEENDLITPTLKLKRPQAAKAFRDDIDRMYDEINKNESKAKSRL